MHIIEQMADTLWTATAKNPQRSWKSAKKDGSVTLNKHFGHAADFLSMLYELKLSVSYYRTLVFVFLMCYISVTEDRIQCYFYPQAPVRTPRHHPPHHPQLPGKGSLHFTASSRASFHWTNMQLCSLSELILLFNPVFEITSNSH